MVERVFKRWILYARGLLAYIKDLKEYKQQQATVKNDGKFLYSMKNSYPYLMDRFKWASDAIDGHYFLQDIWGGGIICKAHPQMHYDIGSRVDGFISHLLCAGINVTMIDIRPLPIEIEGLYFLQGNALDLTGIQEASIDSLSSLHALEHFGLGRYGDPIDINGWKKALLSYERVLAANGILYLSVPIGLEDKLCFNGHRIFNPNTIVDALEKMELVSFEYINDMKIIKVENVKEYSEKKDFLCGLFIFRKIC